MNKQMATQVKIRNFLRGEGYEASLYRSKKLLSDYIVAWKGDELFFILCVYGTSELRPDVEEEFNKFAVPKMMKKLIYVRNSLNMLVYSQRQELLRTVPLHDAELIAQRDGDTWS